MSVEQLVAFAGINGLRKKGKKKKIELVEYILTMLNPTDSQVESTKEFLKNLDSALHQEYSQHEFYREHFNGVDLFDRLWYDSDEKHTIKEWRAKYFYSLLRSASINLFVCENETERMTWKKFYTEFLKEFYNLGEKWIM